MSVLIFIIIIGVLIFVHELGHFLIAKKNGIRVDEFAIGFPPKIFSITFGGTKYSLNLIPFGGYVKIFGENPDEQSSDPNRSDSFVNKPRYIQAAVLVGGVFFNMIFAWILLSISLMFGLPSVITEKNINQIQNPSISIVQVVENSPAFNSQIKVGDKILQIQKNDQIISGQDLSIEKIQEIIRSDDNSINLILQRKNQQITTEIQPTTEINNEYLTIGIIMQELGDLKFSFFRAIYEGFFMTLDITKQMSLGLYNLIKMAIIGQGSFDDVAGPVGIVKIVDRASVFGFVYLLSFTAFISINLAVLNILPFPALDGGRLLVVLIESIIRKPLNSKIVNIVNASGFIILILLMIFITIKDVSRLF
ncbi:MAG TPA: site-2 protease family protein [Candidatus Paceibacterota bacterium]|nr:site-2 protease family protein [Candidatus Paceibacterota bacterium]HMP18865.1 site-2 protease family protein [Candidatus Paceibacterota bacterium]HMP85171.1 site-2 protease family protein [Candidatus Paceibacterota bacterium]